MRAAQSSTEWLGSYIPMDRRLAMVTVASLPDRARGAALFADVSGFTPLTEALEQELGPRQGAEELTRQLNRVYDALIAEVHRYRGSVITFSGDAITCWFDGDDGCAATVCALSMQAVMKQIAKVKTPSGFTTALAMKAAVAAGAVRRFLIGDPQVQIIDVLAGKTLDRMAEAGTQAVNDEVVLSSETVARLGEKLEIAGWRTAEDKRVAIVSRVTCQVEPDPWPVLTAEAEALTQEQMRPWLLPPVYARLQAGGGRFLAELRPAVALFLKFSGLDYDQDEAAGAKLDDYLRWVQRILTRYEGYLLQVMFGDKGSYLYAAFGAPLAHDDDPVRATAAALELRSLPPELNFITGVQIGVSQGRMRAGAYGASSRRTYGVLGDEVNIAARLMDAAETGQILVSHRIADAAARSFHFDSKGTVRVKGKRQPLGVLAPLDRQGVTPPGTVMAFPPPLVEREDELERMEQVLNSVLEGAGQVLRLEGVAGVGKSHLLAEFVARTVRRNVRVALGACQSTSQSSAYYPWRQMFRTLLELKQDSFAGLDPVVTATQQIAQVEAIIGELNPDWLLRLPLLGDLLGLPVPDNSTTAAFDPQLRQEALFALVVEMTRSWARTQPLFLVIEDAYWMDEASIGLTMALGRAIADAPILLSLVHRPSSHEDRSLLPNLNHLPNYHAVSLNELSPQGVNKLVSVRLEGEASKLALDLIQAQAHGNPFFTRELVNTLRESGGLYRQENGTWTLSEEIVDALQSANCLLRDASRREWVLDPHAQLSAVDLGVPDTIHGVVLSRLDRLPEADKLTLKVASVIGRLFEFDLLVQAHPVQTDQDVIRAQMKTLEEKDFAWAEIPSPRLTYTFKHNIVQEVAYETLLERQQRELHQNVGDALEMLDPEAVERLAYHYSRSDVRDKTLFYLDKAALKTQREYANETALNYYSQALALEERWQWRIGQVEVLHILGRREEEVAALKTLEKLTDAPVFDVAYLWGQFYDMISDYAKAQAAVEQALAGSRDQDDTVGEARCLAQLGLISRRAGDYERAQDWYNRALALFQDHVTYSDAEEAALTEALNGLGIVHRQLGNWEQAEACCERALAFSRESGNRMGEVKALNNLGIMAFYHRDYTEALTYHGRALEIRRTIGDRPGEGQTLYDLAISTFEAGDYGQAESYFLEALAIQQAVGNRWEEVNVWNGLGALYHSLGELDRAESCLWQGLALAQGIGDEAGQVYVLSNLGVVLRDLGELEAAENAFNDGLALAQAQEDKYTTSYLLSHLGITSLQAGRLTQAIDQADAALKLRRELDLRLWTTADLATLAAAYLAAGDGARAVDCAEQALTILDDCGGEGPEAPHHDYFICYQVFAAAGQTARACAALRCAHDIVMARAERITDLDSRQSFLDGVPINLRIMERAVGEGIA